MHGLYFRTRNTALAILNVNVCRKMDFRQLKAEKYLVQHQPALILQGVEPITAHRYDRVALVPKGYGL